MGSQIDLNKHFSIISQISKAAAAAAATPAAPPKFRHKIERPSGGQRDRGRRSAERERERERERWNVENGKQFALAGVAKITA